MFFCEPCREERSWPDSMFTSYGRCEICDKVAECNDVPSRYLPVPKPKKIKTELDIDSIT